MTWITKKAMAFGHHITAMHQECMGSCAMARLASSGFPLWVPASKPVIRDLRLDVAQDRWRACCGTDGAASGLQTDQGEPAERAPRRPPNVAHPTHRSVPPQMMHAQCRQFRSLLKYPCMSACFVRRDDVDPGISLRLPFKAERVSCRHQKDGFGLLLCLCTSAPMLGGCSPHQMSLIGS